MRLRPRGLAIGSLLLVASAWVWPGSTIAGAMHGPTGEVDCAFAGAKISVDQGLAGAGNYSIIIKVENAPFEPCALPVYPTVDLFDEATGSYLLPTQSPEGPLGTGSTPTKVPSSISLAPGAVASALLGGTEMPHDGAQTCPDFSLIVRLLGSTVPTQFDRPLPDCSGFALGPFTLGFNGESPTGEVVGTATRCTPPSFPVTDGSLQVGAWHDGKLVDFVQSNSASIRPKPYQMVLNPGRYRITSGHLRPRRIVVRAGMVENIGRFGACAPLAPPTTPRTAPPRGVTVMPTTTTTGTSGSSMPPCTDGQLRISTLRDGAAGGAVSEVITFSDISSEPCSLTGYPGVAALDSQGLQVEQARRQLNAMMGGQDEGTQPQTVPLEPGTLATATVEGSDNPLGSTKCPAYFPSFLVTAPDGTTSVTLAQVGLQGPDFAEQGFPGCSPLVVTPVVPGTTGSPLPTLNTP